VFNWSRIGAGTFRRGGARAWHPLRDPALWLGVSVAAPYVGMLGYFLWQIGRALGIV
jgi:hypothetical protein